MTSPDTAKHPLFHQIRETMIMCEGYTPADQTVIFSMALLQRMHRGLADTARADLQEAVSDLRKMISPDNPNEPSQADIAKAAAEITRAADEGDEATRMERGLAKELRLLGFDETDLSAMLLSRFDLSAMKTDLANGDGAVS
jgi:hypothetical protein